MRNAPLKFYKLVIVLLIGTVSSLSYAGCPKTSGDKHLVLTMEGLGGRMLGSQAARLANSIKSGAGFELASYSHTTPNATMIKCIKKWKESVGPGFRLSVIGHSFGGRDALKLAHALSGTGLSINDLIILDGREGSDTGSHCRGNMSKPYPKPPNVGKTTNFYGCNSMLNGRLVSGSENHYVANSHVGIPNDPYVRSKVGYILRGIGGGDVAPNTGVAANSDKDAVNIMGNATRQQKIRQMRRSQAAVKKAKVYRCDAIGGTRECSAAEMNAQNIRNYGGSAVPIQ